MSKSNVIGLMSGTSLDGIDAVLVEISEESKYDFDTLTVKPYQFLTLPYPDELKSRLLELCDEKATVKDVSFMNMLLGEWFAEAAFKVVEVADLDMREIHLISSHGQTIFHQPKPIDAFGYQVTSTLQIGDVALIAERTGVTTVGDFRTRDMAAGGQGAPLVPYVDYLLFRDKTFGRVLLNIGGISNMTVLPPNCKETEVLAYDTGPGNMIMDAFMTWGTLDEQHYDHEGKLASKGTVDQDWLASMLEHPYFKLPFPKSTGREMFGFHFARQLWEFAESKGLSLEDRVATVNQLTAITIVDAIKCHLSEGVSIDEVWVSGGGSHNKTLLSNIRGLLPHEVALHDMSQQQISSDAKEAITFAVLGYQCLKNRVNTLPSATGADHPVSMGKIVRGKYGFLNA